MTASRCGLGRTLAALFAVALVLALSVCGSAAWAAAEGPHMSPVVQCRDDFGAVCAKADSARQLWGCMMKNADKIQNAVCRDYVVGFRACTRDAERKSSCVNPAADYATSVRRCLRAMPESALSPECLNSRFYYPIAEVRHANDPPKAEAGDK